MEPHWKFHWLTRWDEIWAPDFLSQWQSWLDHSPSAHVFFHPALAKAWVETYLPLRNIKPVFLIAESSEHTIFFPLVLWKRDWKNAFQRILIPVGYSDYDYHNPIITGGDPGIMLVMDIFWTKFINILRDTKDFPVRFDCFISDGIRQPVAGKDNNGWLRQDSCPWIDLLAFKKPEEFLPSLGIKLRHDLRRQERRINEVGALQYRIFPDDMEKEALDELTPFLVSYASHWPEAYKAPYLHENIVKQSMKANLLHFSVLKIGKESAAWNLSMIFHNCYYSYIVSYEDKFARFSPGKIILLKCIEDAIRKGLSTFDCLRGEESYKAGWADKAEPLWSLRSDGNNLMSKVRNTIVDRLKPGLKRLY